MPFRHLWICLNYQEGLSLTKYRKKYRIGTPVIENQIIIISELELNKSKVSEILVQINLLFSSVIDLLG